MSKLELAAFCRAFESILSPSPLYPSLSPYSSLPLSFSFFLSSFLSSSLPLFLSSSLPLSLSPSLPLSLSPSLPLSLPPSSLSLFPFPLRDTARSSPWCLCARSPLPAVPRRSDAPAQRRRAREIATSSRSRAHGCPARTQGTSAAPTPPLGGRRLGSRARGDRAAYRVRPQRARAGSGSGAPRARPAAPRPSCPTRCAGAWRSRPQGGATRYSCGSWRARNAAARQGRRRGAQSRSSSASTGPSSCPGPPVAELEPRAPKRMQPRPQRARVLAEGRLEPEARVLGVPGAAAAAVRAAEQLLQLPPPPIPSHALRCFALIAR
jgi:hypothetical protein